MVLRRLRYFTCSYHFNLACASLLLTIITECKGHLCTSKISLCALYNPLLHFSYHSNSAAGWKAVMHTKYFVPRSTFVTVVRFI